jgi:hypothetical protein
MSCSDSQKLLSYYSNKINIYDNPSFIPLPDWNSCPPPPAQIYMEPEYVFPSAGPYMPLFSIPIQPPMYYAGEACADTRKPCAPCGTTTRSGSSCGPCGR